MLIASLRAIIKKSLSEDEIATENLARECQAYGLPAVASATCFRSLYDVIDRHTIALEWLDTTLSSIAYCPSMRIYNIMRAVLKSALLSCDALTKHQHVNTGTGFHLHQKLLMLLNTNLASRLQAGKYSALWYR